MPTKTDLDIIPYPICVQSALGSTSSFLPSSTSPNRWLGPILEDSYRTLSYFLDSLWSVTRRSHPSVRIQGTDVFLYLLHCAISAEDLRRDFCFFFFVFVNHVGSSRLMWFKCDQIYIFEDFVRGLSHSHVAAQAGGVVVVVGLCGFSGLYKRWVSRTR